jgi:hypothetical protein
VAGFRLDRTTLDRLIDRYEELRDRDGMGSMLRRVSPGQRIDALQICVAAYAAGCVPDGDQRAYWLAHLRPVLAETSDAAALLRKAFEDVGSENIPDPGPLQSLWAAFLDRLRRLRRWPSATTVAIVAAILVALIGVLVTALTNRPTRLEPPVNGQSIQSGGVPDSSLPGSPGADLKIQYERFLKLTLAAAARYDNEITPYALAAALSGAAPELGEPSFVLAEMMRAFPVDPAASIPHNALGAMALRHYAALAAALSARESLSSFDDLIGNDQQLSPDRTVDYATRLREFQAARKEVPRAALMHETWSPWLRYLPLLVLLPGLTWAFWGPGNRRRELASTALRDARIKRAEFRRAKAGSWGKSEMLQSSADLPPLPAASQTARRLMRLREPRPDSRLDLARSARASLASAGDVVTVMRDGSRAVDIVFLVRRRHRHDHERARVLRLLDALSRNGVTLTAYDYSPDPRTLTATSRTDAANPRGHQRTLDLRGLRELHGDSLLVIVSDGEDLVDSFSQKPHPFVRQELRLWQRRMLLTPVPIAEWGEREFSLAAALAAPLGRATMAGLGDLALGLAPDSLQSHPRRILDRALRRFGLFERTLLWCGLAESILSQDETAPRPASVERLGVGLLQELGPSPLEQKALIAELKGWLGPGFFWLAACGVYPELRVDLTLWLGARLHRYGHPANPRIFSEDLFNRLCLMPWFRACYMPVWLRTAAFEALSGREKAMIRAVIDELAAGKGYQSSRQTLGLQVWQADWRDQPLTPDDVMIEFQTDREPSSQQRSTETDAMRSARSRWFVRGLGRTAMVAAWAGFAVWLTPAFQSAPHPSGAWWPVIGFTGASLLWLVTIVALKRAGLLRRIDDSAVSPESMATGSPSALRKDEKVSKEEPSA